MCRTSGRGRGLFFRGFALGAAGFARAGAGFVGAEGELADLRSQLESVRRNRAADGKRLTEMRRLLELAESEHARNRSLVEKEVMAASKLEASEKALLQRQLEFIDLENRVSRL